MDFVPRVKHTIEVKTVRPEMEYIIVYSLYLAFKSNPYGYSEDFEKVYEHNQTFCGSYGQACNKAARMKTDFMYANIDIILPSAEQNEELAKRKAELAEVKSMIKQVIDRKKGIKNGMK